MSTNDDTAGHPSSEDVIPISDDELEQLTDEELVELMNRAQKRVELKVQQLNELQGHVADRGSKILRLARNVKLAIIFLAAFVATRAIADGIWADTGSNPEKVYYVWFIVMPYTITAVAIAILGGVDSVFKYGETSAEVNYLRVRCSTAVDDFRAIWAGHVEPRGASISAMRIANSLFSRLIQQHREIETRLVQLGIPLPRYSSLG